MSLQFVSPRCDGVEVPGEAAEQVLARVFEDVPPPGQHFDQGVGEPVLGL